MSFSHLIVEITQKIVVKSVKSGEAHSSILIRCPRLAGSAMSPNVSGPKIVVSGPEKWLSSSGGNGSILDIAGARSCRPEAVSGLSRLEARLATFDEWPPGLEQRPEELAEAGFYYTGRQT